jgi:hypothetical protein
MYLLLNPKKIRSFTTKGIHLTILHPVGYIQDNIEDEFRLKIDQAIINEELYIVSENTADGLILPGIGTQEGVEETEDSKIYYTTSREPMDNEIHEVVDIFGNRIKVRRMQTTLTLPNEEIKEMGSNVILTDGN